MRGDVRYTLHGYVCGPGCWHPTSVQGTVTFEYVYMNRPSPCRYAVASSYGAINPVIVWDLFQTKRDAQWRLYPPEPVRVGDSIDAAIVATEMLYEEG